MKVKKFKVKHDTQFCKKDEIVYDLMQYDYGLASDDTRVTGVQHTSVTRNSDGDYPSVTIPISALEEICD